MMYILSGKNGRFNSSSRTLFGDRAKRVYVLLYSSIVDRQREDENDVDDERDERNET